MLVKPKTVVPCGCKIPVSHQHLRAAVTNSSDQSLPGVSLQLLSGCFIVVSTATWSLSENFVRLLHDFVDNPRPPPECKKKGSKKLLTATRPNETMKKSKQAVGKQDEGHSAVSWVQARGSAGWTPDKTSVGQAVRKLESLIKQLDSLLPYLSVAINAVNLLNTGGPCSIHLITPLPQDHQLGFWPVLYPSLCAAPAPH